MSSKSVFAVGRVRTGPLAFVVHGTATILVERVLGARRDLLARLWTRVEVAAVLSALLLRGLLVQHFLVTLIVGTTRTVRVTFGVGR